MSSYIESLGVGRLSGDIERVDSNTRSGTATGNVILWNKQQLISNKSKEHFSLFYFVIVSLHNSVYIKTVQKYFIFKCKMDLDSRIGNLQIFHLY